MEELMMLFFAWWIVIAIPASLILWAVIAMGRDER